MTSPFTRNSAVESVWVPALNQYLDFGSVHRKKVAEGLSPSVRQLPAHSGEKVPLANQRPGKAVMHWQPKHLGSEIEAGRVPDNIQALCLANFV